MARKYRDAIRIVTRDGWYYSYSRGGHDYYYHDTKRTKVTIDGRPGQDVPRYIWSSIMRQAGLKVKY